MISHVLVYSHCYLLSFERIPTGFYMGPLEALRTCRKRHRQGFETHANRNRLPQRDPNDRPPERTKSGIPQIPNFRKLLFDFSQLLGLFESYFLTVSNF